MPRPTSGDSHVNSLLTNLAVKPLLKPRMFAAADIFPICPVEKQSDAYVVYDTGDFLRDEAAERAPGTESRGGNYDIDTTPTYTCRNYAFHKDVDDDVAANADKPIDPYKDAMQYCIQKLLIKRERIFINNFVKAGVWSTNLTGVSGTPSTNQFKQWAASGSTPVKDVDSWCNTIEGLTGEWPNVLAIAPDVLSALKSNSDIISRIQYTQKGIITTDILAELFDIEKVVVLRGVYNNAKKGATTAVTRMTSAQALLAYAAPRPSTENYSAGYMFAWKGRYGSNKLGARIKKFRMEELNSERIEAELSFDAKLVAPDMGVYASSVVA